MKHFRLFDNEELDWLRYSGSETIMEFFGSNDPELIPYRHGIGSRYSVIEHDGYGRMAI